MIQAIEFFRFNNLSKFTDIEHFVTTKIGGYSKDQYASLNIGFGTDDNSQTVLENRKYLAEQIKIPLENFVFANQVHSAHCKIIEKADMGAGASSKSNAIKETDALITNQSEIVINVMGADCVPILLFDPIKKVTAAIHAGWRGTVQNITGKTVERMIEQFHCNPSDIYAGIGPSIGSCCYEVGQEVIEGVSKLLSSKLDDLILKKEKSTHLDLWLTNIYLLEAAGLKRDKIENSGICTYCNAHKYYSSRKMNGDTGRFVAGIYIKQ